MLLFIIIFLGLYIIWKIICALPIRFPRYQLSPSRLTVVYGGPGSGKSTYAAFVARKALAAGYPVFSNVPIKGCFEINKSDIGLWHIPSGLLIIDEAGVEYNNRNFKKNFSGSSQDSALEWWKKHRHEGVECIICSQGFNDMDKKLQTLGSHYYIVRHSLIPGMITIRQIRKRPQIDDKTHQPIDYYDWQPFSKKRIFMRPLWKYFDSFDKMNLPIKEYRMYGAEEEKEEEI